jgi:hypothetical protein
MRQLQSVSKKTLKNLGFEKIQEQNLQT